MIFREEFWFLVSLAILTFLSWRFRKKKTNESIRIPKKHTWKISEKFRFSSFFFFGAFSLVFIFSFKNMNFQLSEHRACASEIPYSHSTDNFKDFLRLTSQEFTQEPKFNSSPYLVLTNTVFSLSSKIRQNYLSIPKCSAHLALQLWLSLRVPKVSGYPTIQLFEFISFSRHGARSHANTTLGTEITDFGHFAKWPRPVTGFQALDCMFLYQHYFSISTSTAPILSLKINSKSAVSNLDNIKFLCSSVSNLLCAIQYRELCSCEQVKIFACRSSIVTVFSTLEFSGSMQYLTQHNRFNRKPLTTFLEILQMATSEVAIINLSDVMLNPSIKSMFTKVQLSKNNKIIQMYPHQINSVQLVLPSCALNENPPGCAPDDPKTEQLEAGVLSSTSVDSLHIDEAIAPTPKTDGPVAQEKSQLSSAKVVNFPTSAPLLPNPSKFTQKVETGSSTEANSVLLFAFASSLSVAIAEVKHLTHFPSDFPLATDHFVSSPVSYHLVALSA